jgi:hypothetical protein
MTSACNILKLLVKHSNDLSTSSTKLTVKTKSTITLRATIRSRTERSSSCSANSQRSRSSLGERWSVIGQVPSRAILLALRACRQFIMCRNNEDIDGQYEVMWNSQKKPTTFGGALTFFSLNFTYSLYSDIEQFLANFFNLHYACELIEKLSVSECNVDR